MQREPNDPSIMARLTRGAGAEMYLRSIGVEARHKDIELDLLSAAPWQPRKIMATEELLALRDSIRKSGLINPIIVRPHPVNRGEFQVLAGHRRLRATRELRDETNDSSYARIACKVVDLNDQRAFELTIAENRHTQVSVLEASLAYCEYRDKFDSTDDPLTVDRLASLFGCSSGKMCQYTVIGDGLSPATLRLHGMEIDAETLCAAVSGSSNKSLHALARLPIEERLRELTVRLERSREAPTGTSRRRPSASAAQGDASTAHTAHADHGSLKPPRFSVEQLIERGGCNVNLQGAFKRQSPRQSLHYLQDVSVVVTALLEVVETKLQGTVSLPDSDARGLSVMFGDVAARLIKFSDRLREPGTSTAA